MIDRSINCRIAVFAAIACTFVLMIPRQASAQPGPTRGQHLFILSGQSNMRRPLPESFRECVEQVFGKDNVIVVTLGRPSQPIRRWYKDWTRPEGMAEGLGRKGNPKIPPPNGQLYDALLKAVQRAIDGRQLASVTFVWMQGEADAGAGWGSVYEKSFLGILDQFKDDLQLDSINFVIGRINDHWRPERGTKDGDVVRAVQAKLGEEHDNGDWVNTDDLNRGINPWGGYEREGGHFPNPAYIVLGKRFAKKACKLIDTDINFNEAIFDEVFFDSADDVKTHASIGASVALDVVGANDHEAELLADGKFANPAAPGDDALLLRPNAARNKYAVTMNLGKKITLTGVGVNVLVNSQANAGLPRQLVISVSSDGKEYTPIHRKGITFFYRKVRAQREAQMHGKALFAYLATSKDDVQYVKVDILGSDGPGVMIDEIVVNPTLKK